MSKKLNTIITGAVIAAVSAGIATTLSSKSLAESSTTASTPAVLANATTSPLTTTDETIYAFTDASGTQHKVISSGLTKVTQPADTHTPIKLDIRYTLDGKEVSATEIKGKSGKVTIEYNFTNTERRDGYYVPYAVLTGLILDSTHFENIEVENARLISDGTRNIIAGITLPGAQENLGLAKSTFDLPSSIKITTDAKNFELGMTASLATTELFKGIDTSKLSTIDDLSSQLTQLTDGMEQLISGSSKLADGLSELDTKSVALVSGIEKLANGSAELSAGIYSADEGVATLNAGLTQLSAGLSALSNGSEDLNTNTAALINNYRSTLDAAIAAIDDADPVAAATKTYLTQTKATLDANLPTLLTSLGTYTGTVDYISSNLDTQILPGISDLKAGTEKLYNGSVTLADGLSELDSATPTLKSGISQLKSGSASLKDGLIKFNNEGISRLVSAYGDVQVFSNRLKDIVSVAKSAPSTKYIYRTDEIK